MTNLISLEKKVTISLQKKNIFGEKANIVLAIDISASMDKLYSKGVVQQVVERLLAIGLNMDNNRQIDVFAFGRNAHEIQEARESNIEGFVKNILLKKVRLEGSTYYAGVMNKIINKFGKPLTNTGEKKGFFSKMFGKKEETSSNGETPKVPTFVFFITDGDNFDQDETTALMQEVSEQPIFWQFVGISDPDQGYKTEFSFLKKLDDMKGRTVDNADFFQCDDIATIDDQELYDRLLTEFPHWLKEVRNKGVLAQ